ncbi:unnamed protein product [Brassica napus]|uniref:(rape) hypothetical protein n=1 Tax=Brassica napus TaxID=3708 RepID=A0A816PBG4_BRANA|nr:unnamed protein product [Brassica napus]
MAEMIETEIWREIRGIGGGRGRRYYLICGQRLFGGHGGGGGELGGGVRYEGGHYQPKCEGTLSNIANYDWLRQTELDIVPRISQFQIGSYVYGRSFANDLAFS